MSSTSPSIQDKARTLRALHDAPEILRVVNVWDAASAKTVASLPETKALAIAGHSVAAAHGYPDNENIPLDLLIAAVERIVQATDLPVSADLDGGFGNAAETVRRAVGVGVVGANIEDRLRPIDESAQLFADAIQAAKEEGVDFVLNARTDAFVLGGDRPRDVILADAIERGRAYLEAGATNVFVPGPLDREAAEQLVEGIGANRVSVIGLPGNLSGDEYEKLGIARISFGPLTQNYVLNQLKQLAGDLYRGGSIPDDLEQLN